MTYWHDTGYENVFIRFEFSFKRDQFGCTQSRVYTFQICERNNFKTGLN